MNSLRKVRSYIGAVYKNGQWTWTDGSAWDFENWRSGDPSDLPWEKYAEIYVYSTGAWNSEDNIIGYDNGYICQKEAKGILFKEINNKKIFKGFS